ncbi:MAG: alpha/beta hydrolase-fold protein [Candidatus Neomarinimicrobiota bacterium]
MVNLIARVKFTLQALSIICLAAIGFGGCLTTKQIDVSQVDRTMHDDRFIQFLNNLEQLSDPQERQQAADDFMATVTDTPLIENDSTVVFLYQGTVDKIGITGDMNLWDGVLPLERIGATDLFYRRISCDPAARLEYWLIPEPGDPFAVDPLNPYRIWNGLGPVSELALPGYRRHPYFNDYQYGKKWDCSTLDALELPPGVMSYPHQVHVHLPPGYDRNDRKYPTVYIQDGLDYAEFAIVPAVLDQLTADGRIEPVIAVFVTPPNRHQPKMPNRMTEYGLNDDYVTFFCDELVPEIERRYRVESDPGRRLVVGDSFGGLISLYIGFERPDVFGLAYSQSGYQSFQDDRVIKKIATAEHQPVRLYIDVGLYEEKVGVGLLPLAETDFLAANRRLRQVLTEKGYDFVYREYPEGHTWGNWRRHLIDSLIHFFGTGN